MLTLVPHSFAFWAEHLVIAPESANLDRINTFSGFREEAARRAQGVTVSERTNTQVRISLELLGASRLDSDKAYYLVTMKKRLSNDALDLRSILANRSLHRSFAQLQPNWPVNRTAHPDPVAELRRLRPSTQGGTNNIEVVLEQDRALRSYIIWDFPCICESGALVMDGGLWITYDLPAFVEVFGKTRKIR